MGWLNILLKGKKVAGAIKSVKPTLGLRKTAEYKLKTGYKRGASTGYADTIRAAGAEITGKLKKTAEGLDKLTKTLKKQKDIIDKPSTTKHYYPPKDF